MEQLRLGLCECGCGEAAPIARQSNTKRGHVRGEAIRFISGHSNRTPEKRGQSAEHARALGRSQVGDRNPSWRGAEAGYAAVHHWIRRHYPLTGSCEECGCEGRTEWSNTDHTYRRVREDWRELCVPCHRAHDGWREKVALAVQAKRLAPT